MTEQQLGVFSQLDSGYTAGVSLLTALQAGNLSGPTRDSDFSVLLQKTTTHWNKTQNCGFPNHHSGKGF
jgi:hypothetical protein